MFKKPPLPSKRRQGRVAQAQGAGFEDSFMRNCRRNRIAVTRIPDGCKSIGPNRIVRVRTDFDWIITHRGRSGLIDTKTVAGKRYIPSMVCNPHQVAALHDHALSGALAGFVIWFREIDAVCFMPIHQIRAMIASAKGLPASNLMQLGPIASFNPALIFNQPLLSTDPTLGIGS